MISVAEALEALFALSRPLGTERVRLAQAAGRVLAQPVVAERNQPPFAAAAMDGYALKGVEAEPGAMFKVVGTSAAGTRFEGNVGAGQAVRIFTGAPVPVGTDRVIIQEDVTREGNLITLGAELDRGPYVRPLGMDFTIGATLDAPRVLGARDLALIAAMNHAEVTVSRRPEVALIATGDELVMPGETPGPDQIIASNAFGLKAMVEAAGARARLLPIARDNVESLRTIFSLAEGADLVVTIGGASVGDHDLVGPVAAELGLEQSFYKVAMRPGKPLMAGRMGGAVMVGLPGNPVSSMVCGTIFILPMLRAMQGLGAHPAPRKSAPLAVDVPANGPREHYMRASLTPEGIRPLARQDSAMLSILHKADALLVRPTGDAARKAGELVDYVSF
ncbi:gephyrin-like molybdotransferase Glp [Maritimibacter fusiformis]|uniref:Molybdopterin molybdenumtransferase n=1 Tax=Maritimibacter fusiformis TaxID=2603819 RepID=A0A5D0RM93_9RHOB|nr:gephyrin-like molybdotransferase Glp [Maritimibacter fusiformis]TYB82760.1 molybdopterin molybdotransferase MoeA [Maritimibacter fusiformis]